jgi:hypothetical protein
MTHDEPLAAVEALTVESQQIGAQMDAMRERRREIKQQIHKLLAHEKLARFAAENPGVVAAMRVDAEVPGAVVEVSAAEALAAMAAAAGGT